MSRSAGHQFFVGSAFVLVLVNAGALFSRDAFSAIAVLLFSSVVCGIALGVCGVLLNKYGDYSDMGSESEESQSQPPNDARA